MNLNCKTAEPAPMKKPTRSLVTVRFPNWHCPLAYYNDRFNLQPGDQVFVSGKFAGTRGTVVSVTTRFKIHLSDYERIIANPRISFHGTYEQIAGMFVAFGEDAMSADTFRAWVLPPRAAVQKKDQNQDPDQPLSVDEECDEDSTTPYDDVVFGEGYSVELDKIENAEGAKQVIIDRAKGYCAEDRVLFLNIKDGTGTAFISGTQIYEINFQLYNSEEHGWEANDIYCDCPYPGLCKHAFAALFTLKEILAAIPPEKSTIGGSPNFTCISQTLFWDEVRKDLKTVTIE